MTITLHNVEKPVADWLQREADRNGTTPEQVILSVLRYVSHENRGATEERGEDTDAARYAMPLDAMYGRMVRENLALPRTGIDVNEELSRLAGTWSQQDRDEFEKNVSTFNQIDKDLWQ